MPEPTHLTARKCKAQGLGVVLSCRTCRVVKDVNVGAIVARGRGDDDLERSFIEGKLCCSRCRTPADWMRVNRVAPSSGQETVLYTWWRRQLPSSSLPLDP